MNTESAVQQRYAAAAQRSEAALCCPAINYNRDLLKVIPDEVIDKDYGCGDPSKYIREGEIVLDLGSGTGKICFIAAQVVGSSGRVIGVDMTDPMLEVARRNAPIVAGRLGYANVEFRKGRIQDLALDLDALDAELREKPIAGANAFLRASELAVELRRLRPLVATESIDVVVSNCVLNLVEPGSKRQLFSEIFRVLRDGGRAVISDIVSNEEVPDAMRNDPELWSGCISGALQESAFLRAFEEAGFHGIRMLARGAEPWRVVEGIEFRSVTVEAFKSAAITCVEHTEKVIYKGPFREVIDDAGHRFRRGEQTGTCGSILERLFQPPYQGQFERVSALAAMLKSSGSGPGAAKPVQFGKLPALKPLAPATASSGDCCSGGKCC